MWLKKQGLSSVEEKACSSLIAISGLQTPKSQLKLEKTTKTETTSHTILEEPAEIRQKQQDELLLEIKQQQQSLKTESK